MTPSGALYKKLGDWFKSHPDRLTPKYGLDYSDEQIEDYRPFFDPNETIDLVGFYLDGTVNEALSQALYEPPDCNLINLPMIVAIQAGIRGPQLVEIAKHHHAQVSTLADTLQTMEICDYTIEDAHGANLPLSELTIECVKAMSAAFPEQFAQELIIADPGSDLYIAAMHSENAKFWQSSRISAHMKGMEQGLLDDTLESFMSECNFNSTVDNDNYVPRDALGVRYDLFLERSGMLLPEVARKKIGNILLWEDMLDVAKNNGEGGMAGLLKYCIHDAPKHLRPAIFKGLSGISLQTSDYDGYSIFNFFKKSVADTWLEPIAENPQFIVSVLGCHHPLTLNEAFFPNSTWQGELDHPDLAQASGILQRCLETMMNVPIDEMGASHFQIHLIESFDFTHQTFSKGFKPEPILIHLFKGFESYSLPETRGLQRDFRLDDAALKTCLYVTKTLESHFELDYKAFERLSSNCIRLLAEAGLDKRRLPRMNNRDRGHLVSQELGL